MKKRFLSYSIALVLVGWGFVDAKAQQPLKVGANPTNINRTAVLDVEATNKGALLPRVALTSLTDVTTIANPANALTVFNTATNGTAPDNVTPGYYYYSTAINKWVRLLSQGDAISTSVSNTSSTNSLTTTVNGVTGSAVSIINGNTLTAASNTITSTVNGVAAVLTPTAGGTIAENLGFNAAGDLVRQTASSTSQNIYNTDGTLTGGARTITMGGNSLNFRSNSTSTLAYFTYGRTALEMDMGVAGANDNGLVGVVPGDGWLASTNNLFLGTRGTGNFRVVTGAAGSGVTRLFINSTGNVGISNTAPTERLDVTGNIRFSGALMPNNAAGTAGQVLTSAGAGAAPTWGSVSNIYTADGTLTANRTINTAGRTLNFLSNSTSNLFYMTLGRTAAEVDFGVAGANDNGLAGTVPGDGWLASTTNLFVGTRGTGAFNLVTGSGGGTTRISISNAGNVGVGTTSPTERLDVSGNVRFSGALMPNNVAGTAGQLLSSGGAGAAPTWVTLNSTNTPNIYTLDGTLTADRTVNTAGKFLNFRSNSTSALAYISYGRTATEMDMGVAGANTNGLDVTTPGDAWVAGTNNLYVGTRGSGSFNVVTGAAGSGATRMTINSAGRVGIGLTNPLVKLHVGDGNFAVTRGTNQTSSIGNGDATSSGFVVLENGTTSIENNDASAMLKFARRTGASPATNFTLDAFVEFRGANAAGTVTFLGGIYPNGTRNGLTYATSSDMRLKENIVPTHLGLAAVNDIKVYDYNFKTDTDKTPQTGFLAQELYKIFPQAVSVGGDDPKVKPWAVDYGKLTPILVKAIQEQQVQIEALKKEIENLKNK